MRSKRLCFTSVVLVVFASILCGGCAPARKPTPPPATPTQPVTPAPARKPLPTDPRELSRLASLLAREAAQVPGVRRATVVLAGRTAYVGLSLKAGLSREAAERAQGNVATRLKRAEPRLSRVMVTTNPDTYTRIRRIQEGIAKGKPLSAFANELREIDRRVTPAAR